MKLKNILSAIALLTITLSVNAQEGSQKKAEGPGNAIMQPFSILMRLEPVVLNPSPELSLF